MGSLSACAPLENYQHEQRETLAANLIAASGYRPFTLPSQPFPLFAAASAQNLAPDSSGSLNIVIEGDGFAWSTRRTPSWDPTPKDPIGLRWALGLGGQNTLYLARPCQYITGDLCDIPYWTDQRFDPKIIDSFQSALNQIKTQTGAQGFHLYGYSGGAYVALVLAAKREDIRAVTTAAGLLDPPAWTDYHGVTPLQLPETTAALQARTAHIPFVDYCGADDETVPCALTQAFAAHAPNHRVVTIPNADHLTIVAPVLTLMRQSQASATSPPWGAAP